MALAALGLAIGNCDKLLLPFLDVCGHVIKLIGLVVSEIEKLNRAEIELTTKCKKACKSAYRVVRKGFFYIVKVDDFVQCARDEREFNEVKARVRQGDFKPLLYLVHQLKQHLTKATSIYGELSKACEEAEASCLEASTECTDNHRRAQFTKTAVQVGGGTAAGVLIAGGATAGVILSVVAGVFTFGVGTIVGLSLTAVGTAVAGLGVGAGTAVGTHMAANHFDDLAQRFGELGANFNSISSIASGLCDAVVKVEFQLQRAAEELVNIDYCYDHQLIEYACKALDILWSKCDTLYKMTSVNRENLKKQKKSLKNLVATL